MINVSNEFRQLMNKNTDFKENAEITFADGTFLELSEKDFTVTNNSIVDAAGSNGIPLGVALCRSIQIELMNDDDRFSEYDFFGAVIRLYLTFQLSETVERIEYGTFTVLTPETYGTTVIITALDDMYKADKDYITTLPFPSTIGLMLKDACTTLGILQGTTTFLNDNFIVQNKPEDITCRQLFGYISMIAGGNARIDTTGRLRIISYNFESMDDVRNKIDGGSFAPWSNVVELDGGDFTYNTGDFADGGNFLEAINYHILNNWSNLKVDTDDIVITGVSTDYTDSNNEQHNVVYGTEGYVIKIENPLIVENEKTAVGLIGNVIVGGRFRQFSGDLISNPTCEFMDIVAVVDRKNNVYLSFLTDVNFNFFGFTTLKNSATPALRNSSKVYSEATKTFVKARNLINKERTAREQAIAQLAKDLSSSSGLFMTQEKQEDGSIIYYMHDKPTLAESMVIWKLTALAFAISTDGGKTYPYGFTVDGTTITRLLYAEGIDADYIDTGAIRINDENGNTMFLADYVTKNVYINAGAVKIGTKAITDELVEMAASLSLVNDKVELKASKGELSSLLSVESGAISIKSNRFSWESTYSSLSSDGKLTAKDVDLTGKITAKSGGKIGGFDIGENSIYSDSDKLGGTGVYIGTDGISCGSLFQITAKGEVIANSLISSNAKITGGSINISTSQDDWSTLQLNSTGHSCALSPSGIRATNSYGITQIAGNYSNFDGIVTINDSLHVDSITGKTTNGVISVNAPLEITGNTTFKIGYTHTFNGPVKITGSSFDVSATTSKFTGSVSLTGSVNEIAGQVKIAGAGKALGFFGNNGSTKKTVSTITSTSSATASTNATKINEIINALKSYNLI